MAQSEELRKHLRLMVQVSRRDLDFWSYLLWDLGTVGTEEQGSTEHLIITAYFPIQNRSHVEQGLADRACERTYKLLQFDEFASEPEEWIQKCCEFFSGFEVGKTFYIHPSWERPNDGFPVNLLIEPGHGFGTGTHESTQLVLLALEEDFQKVHTVLDIGTGSGILSVAARKLHPKWSVFACEIDPMAADLARQNFERNDEPEIGLVIGGPETLNTSFDLVLANLTYSIIRNNSLQISRIAGQFLLVSGFTVDQEHLVEEALLQDGSFRLTGRLEKNDWVCLRLQKWQQS